MSRFLVARLWLINYGGKKQFTDQAKLINGVCKWEGAGNMLYGTSTVTAFPGLEDGFEMLQVVNDGDAQCLTDIRWNGCPLLYAFFIQWRFSEHEHSFSTNTPSPHTGTHSHALDLIVVCTVRIRRGDKEATHEHLRCFLGTSWTIKLSRRVLGPTGKPLETALRKYGPTIANCWMVPGQTIGLKQRGCLDQLKSC